MPQLDKVTFFAQVTWSLGCYLFLYYLFSVHIAPAIGRVLKVRSKINLGGTAESSSSADSFVASTLSIARTIILLPLAFLKTSDLVGKVATSSAVGDLQDRA